MSTGRWYHSLLFACNNNYHYYPNQFRDEELKSTELPIKLEPAFLSGLRCSQPHIRAKFFAVFDQSIRRRLYDRLLYIICSQSWDAMGSHYWIKQCVELILATTVHGKNSINLICLILDSQK